MHLIEAVDRALAIIQELFPGAGELDAIGGAEEEDRVHLSLELFQDAAHILRCGVHRLAGLCDGMVVVERDEIAHMIDQHDDRPF